MLRRHDPDRFLTALFAPPDRRHALLTLYAFNHELARARDVTSEPTLALIRLQWWREVVEGENRRHEVASPLSAALRAGLLDAADLLAIVDAREAETEPAIETLDEWRAYVAGGPGGLSVAAARLLGAPDPEAFRPFGAAYGVAGILRGFGPLAARGRCLLPTELLERHGLTLEEAIADPDQAALRPVRDAVIAEGRAWLARGRSARVPRSAIAAALPAVLARRDLARARLDAAPRGLGDRLAVTWSGLTGRHP